jgi:hypothetical protein
VGWAHTIVPADGRLVVLESGDSSTNVNGVAASIDPVSGAVARADIPSRIFTPMPVLSREQVWVGVDRGFVRFDPLGPAFPDDAVTVVPEPMECCGFNEADDRGIWFISADDRGLGRHLNLFDPSTGEVRDLVAIDEGDPVAMAITPNTVWVLNYEGTLTHVELH